MTTDSPTIIDLVDSLSEGFKKIIPRSDLRGSILDWGDNGVGDRWAKKIFNYSVVYHNGKTKTYSDNDQDQIDHTLITQFMSTICKTDKGILGIFPHSVKIIQPDTRYIRTDIKSLIVIIS